MNKRGPLGREKIDNKRASFNPIYLILPNDVFFELDYYELWMKKHLDNCFIGRLCMSVPSG